MKAEMTSRMRTRHSLPERAVRAAAGEIDTACYSIPRRAGSEFMVRILLPIVLAAALAAALTAAAFSAEPLYELSGRVMPEGHASVALHGATRPFSTATLSDESGRFTFKKLAAGTYTIAVFVPGRGEARQTVEVGPGAADSRGRVFLTLRLREEDFTA